MAFNETIALESCKTEVVRGRCQQSKFNNWVFVEAAELHHIVVETMEDEFGEYFVPVNICQFDYALPMIFRLMPVMVLFKIQSMRSPTVKLLRHIDQMGPMNMLRNYTVSRIVHIQIWA